LLFYLNLGNKVVGITNYCKYPEKEIKNLKKIGGTKNIKLDIIKTLAPDLIISVKEENNKSDIIKLAENYNVFVGDLTDYKSSLKLIQKIGNICNKSIQAKHLVQNIKNEFSKINISKPKTCCYLIWNNPIMTVGNNTFISSMLSKAGFNNVFAHLQSYPEITEEEIDKKKPEYILLSSEPFNFTEKHRKIYQKKFPASKVMLVDGEMFSWYGNRMLFAPNYFILNWLNNSDFR
jgi:ABC-type Fe3+-hydroxamate transport system substrate-binding protein